MGIITLTKQGPTNSPSPTGQPFEVTPEMLAAGARVLSESGFVEGDADSGLRLLVRDVLEATLGARLSFSRDCPSDER
jgi:hypothetical protein